MPGLEICNKKKPIAIRLGEKQQNHSIISNQNNKKQDDTTSRRCSTGMKKLPVHRSSDFYGEKRFKIKKN
jgi:hypothetical protein